MKNISKINRWHALVVMSLTVSSHLAFATDQPVLNPSVVASADTNPCSVVYEGESGFGKGKHIVWIVGDHEYRSEESVPALARLMAKHYGFKCTVLFTIDPDTGYIQPGSSHIQGLAVLKDADLMAVFLRFQDFPQDEMRHIQDYLESGKPVIGLRTSTHAFKMPASRKFAKHSYNYQGEEFKGGFGRQILGETWAGHYGKNHVTSAAFRLEESQADHPVLRGVKDAWVQSGAYAANPMEDSIILAKSEVLDGMSPDAQPMAGKKRMPAAWVRSYVGKSGKEGRVFCSTHGASEDISNEGFRRLCVNACLWCLGMDDEIKATNDVSLVGPYNTTTFRFGGFRQGVKPEDLSGWNTPIMPPGAPIGVRKKAATKKNDAPDAENLLSGFSKAWDGSNWENKFRGSLYMRPQEDGQWKNRMTILSKLVRRGTSSIPALEKYLTHDNAPTRILAAQAISYLAPNANLKKLIDVAKNDRDPAVRLYAVDAIGCSGKGGSVDWDAIERDEKNRDVLKHINYAKERKDAAIPENVSSSLAQYDSKKMGTAIVGKLAPDFKLTSVNGKEISLSQFRGKKPVVLVFIYGDT